jgi:membrane-bound ClpP family serine protease
MSVLKKTVAQIFRLIGLLLMVPGLILLLFHSYWWLGLILLAVGLLFASIYRQLVGSPIKWSSQSKTGHRKGFMTGTKDSIKASFVMMVIGAPLVVLGIYLLTFSWGKIPGIALLVLGSILVIIGWPLGFPF